MTSLELRKKAAEVRANADKIIAKAREEKRSFTVEERENIDKATTEVVDLFGDAQRLERAETQNRELETSNGRKTDDTSSTRSKDEHGAGKPYRFEFRSNPVQPIEIDQSDANYERCSPEYNDAFGRTLYGKDGAPRSKRNLQVTPLTLGGYVAAPMQFIAQLIKFVDDQNFIRSLSTPFMLGPNVSMGAPSFDTDWADSDWTPEVPATALSDDTAARFGKRELTPHLHTKKVMVSRKLLRSGVFDIAAFLQQRLAYILAKTEEKAFLTGDGAQTPLGVLTASAQGISTGRDVTAAATTAIAKNDFTNLKYSMKGQYMEKAVMIMHRDGVKRLMQIDDGIGRPIFVDSLQTGDRPRVLGMPLYMTEYAMNTFTTGQYVAIAGDFSNYWIADSLSFELQVCDQTAAGTNQIEYFARAEVDGMPVLEEAFARLKLA